MDYRLSVSYRRKYVALLTIIMIGIHPLYAIDPDSLKAELHKETITAQESVQVYYDLSKFFLQSDTDSARIYIELIKEVIDDKIDQGLLSRAYHLLGDAEMMIHNYDSARVCFLKCIEINDSPGFTDVLHTPYLRMGGLAFNQGDYLSAMEYYLKGLKISEDQGLKVAVAVYYTNLAVVHSTQNDYEKALEYLHKTLDIQEKRALHCDQIFTLATIGQMYCDQEMLVKAQRELRKGLDLLHECTNHLFMLQYFAVFGEIETKLENYEVAIDYLNKSVSHSVLSAKNTSEFDGAYMSNIYEQLGMTYQKINDLDGSLTSYRKAMQYCSRELFPYHYQRVAKGISTTFTLLGMQDSAIYYYKEFHDLSEERTNEQSIREITQMELKYEHEKELERKEYENKLNKSVQKKKSQLLNFSFIAVILFLVILFLIYRNALKKSEFKRKHAELTQKNLEMELDYKNKELITKAIYFHRKEEFIQSVAEKIKEFRLRCKPKDDRELGLILKELEQDGSQKEWTEFELRFNEVHDEFYSRLKDKYPELTHNDLKLCAFLKLRMSTKEIASITFQSLNSINVARYRLRKKLHLETDTNLNEFMSELS